MLSLAKLRSCESTELISIGAAAILLKVKRPVIYRWMEERTLDYVRDDISGRTFVVRQDVEAMKSRGIARERGAIDVAHEATGGKDLSNPG
jgi:hypothetical protein